MDEIKELLIEVEKLNKLSESNQKILNSIEKKSESILEKSKTTNKSDNEIHKIDKETISNLRLQILILQGIICFISSLFGILNYLK